MEIQSMNNKGLVYTKDGCQECEKCMEQCPVNVEILDVKSMDSITNQCIHCCQCITACSSHKRDYRDDTDVFLKDLERGEEISVLVAPSFLIQYEKEYKKVFGTLKRLGVKDIYDGAMGFDISTWAYLSYIKKFHFTGGITQPCPVIINLMKKYHPELLEKIMPVQSPMMCTAIYLKKYKKKTEKIAFLSPCVATKDEIDSPENKGYISYNVTFHKLMKAITVGKEKASFKSVPGFGNTVGIVGEMKECIEYFLGQSEMILKIRGGEQVFQYLREYSERIKRHKRVPFLVDARSCEYGCLYGSGTDYRRPGEKVFLFSFPDVRKQIEKLKPEENPYIEGLSTDERMERFGRRFRGVQLKDFLREYKQEPESEADTALQSLMKYVNGLDEMISEVATCIVECKNLEQKFLGTDDKHNKLSENVRNKEVDFDFTEIEKKIEKLEMFLWEGKNGFTKAQEKSKEVLAMLVQLKEEAAYHIDKISKNPKER